MSVYDVGAIELGYNMCLRCLRNDGTMIERLSVPTEIAESMPSMINFSRNIRGLRPLVLALFGPIGLIQWQGTMVLLLKRRTKNEPDSAVPSCHGRR